MNFEENFLRSVKIEKKEVDTSKYPFSVPAIKNLNELTFHPKVTYFVGENGSGKSTLLEAIAIAAGFNPEGGSRQINFSTRDSHSNLFEFLRLIRGAKRPKDGFFLRAESFFTVATAVDETGAVKSYGGKSLHEQSHGESFLSLIVHRFGGQGLYIFDEPEAALSPTRQLTFLSEIHRLVKSGSQFVIATHSPILMAYPDSSIYSFDADCITAVAYEETDHYKITRDFLNQRDKMLKVLLADKED
jgi:predicted ATPase